MLSVPITPALNYEQIKSHPERISKIKPFNEHNDWNEIDFPSHKKTGKSLKKVISQLLLIFYMYLIILKK